MKNLSSRIKAALIAAGCTLSAVTLPIASTSAEQEVIGYVGDVNHDMQVNVSDLVLLSQHILRQTALDSGTFMNADLTHDNIVDSFDLAWLRQYLAGIREIEPIYNDTTEQPTTTTTTTPINETTTTTITTTAIPDDNSGFIPAAIENLGASLPSQGTANLVIFYVDFPDCQYSYSPSEAELQQMAFGDADPSNPMYPFESMSAFYERSSKGTMQLDGKVFRYTTKENKASYDQNKVKIAEECYDAFKDSVDFSQFDGDGDGMIDATLFTVPTAADNDNGDWWPCAGGFGDPYYTVDGKTIGHIITGNAQAESLTDYTNFVSSYLHEMGHCMGLPDYYLYSGSDYEGFHGIAGIELMDADAMSDFCSFSKLMLGWFRENQVQVYDSSAGSQTFALNNAQTDSGNCVIIPYGTLDSQYFSEYFIIEYATNTANNSGLPWWMSTDSGIRVHHVKADFQQGYWNILKYQNGSEYNNGDDNWAGIRLLRILKDTGEDNFFRTGDVIDNSVSGFGWYDSAENEAIDPGVTISIGENSGDQYTITITNK